MKLMTLNINKYGEKHGLWQKRRELIAEAIQKAEPDVVTLQAVRKMFEHNDGIDQASQLAVLLPKFRRVVFQPANVTSNFADGSAVLSKVPDLHADHFALSTNPGCQDNEPRLVLHALVKLMSGDLNLFNGHFSWVGEQNQQNFKEFLPELNRYRRRTILAGDFNATPESPAISALQRDGWVDAWSKLHPDNGGFTFESDNPDKRIDYIFLSPDIAGQLRSCELVRAEVQGTRLSDHLGLVAEIDL